MPTDEKEQCSDKEPSTQKKNHFSQSFVIYENYISTPSLSNSDEAEFVIIEDETSKDLSQYDPSGTEKLLEEGEFEAINKTDEPLKQKPLSKIKEIEPPKFDELHQKNEISKSAHAVSKVRLLNKHGLIKEGFYFFKPNNTSDSVLSELEAAYTGFTALISPYTTPKAWSVYDPETRERRGILVKAIPGFKDFLQKEKPFTSEELDQLIETGLPEILIGNYFLEEDDMHRGNFGRDNQGNTYGIDNDAKLWPITYLEKGARLGSGTILTTPEEAFPITENDIRYFPDVRDFKGFYWPTSFVYSDRDVFIALQNHPKFIYRKYKTLLKIALTDESMYKNIAKVNIHEESTIKGMPAISSISSHMGQRIQALRQILKNMPEFSEFMLKDGERALEEILKEFEYYNTNIYKNKPKYKDQLIDLEYIKKQYKNFKDEVCPSLTSSIFQTFGFPN